MLKERLYPVIGILVVLVFIEASVGSDRPGGGSLDRPCNFICLKAQFNDSLEAWISLQYS